MRWWQRGRKPPDGHRSMVISLSARAGALPGCDHQPGSAPSDVMVVVEGHDPIPCSVLRDPDRDHDGLSVWLAVPDSEIPPGDGHVEIGCLPPKTGVEVRIPMPDGMPVPPGFHAGHGPDGGCSPDCPAWPWGQRP